MRASLMKEESLLISWLIVTLYMEDKEFDELVHQQFFHRALAMERDEKMVETRVNRLKRLRRETWDAGLFVDILSRLPVKSICSLKTVCKSWRGLLSDNYFAKKQLAQSRENPALIACPRMDEEMELYWLRLESRRLLYLNTINPAERSPKDHMYMISSFNGLVCCINVNKDANLEKNRFRDLKIWICNPLTGETLLLPQGTPSLKVEPSVGVAYDSDSSNYRVFRLFGAGMKIPEEKNKIPEESRIFVEDPDNVVFNCEVYSSITGFWENIGPVPRIPMRACISPFRSAHTFAGGKIFWLVSLDEEGEMLSVDMEGRFEVHRLPPYDGYAREDERITEGTYLMNLQGSLSLVILHSEDMDVWTWNDEGREWVFVCQITIRFDELEIVLAMTSTKNQIFCITNTHWWICNLDTGSWRKKKGPSSGFVNPSIYPFTESLLTCNGGVMG